MKAITDLQYILKKGEISNELGLERALVLDRKLSQIVNQHPEIIENLNKLRLIIKSYEDTNFNSQTKIINEIPEKPEDEIPKKSDDEIPKKSDDEKPKKPVNKKLKKLAGKKIKKIINEKPKIILNTEIFDLQERKFIEIRKQTIRRILSENNITQQDLGKLLGHCKSYMSELVNGMCPFSKKDLIILHRLFNIELEYLFPVFISKNDQLKLKNSIKKLNNPKLKLKNKEFEFA